MSSEKHLKISQEEKEKKTQTILMELKNGDPARDRCETLAEEIKNSELSKAKIWREICNNTLPNMAWAMVDATDGFPKKITWTWLNKKSEDVVEVLAALIKARYPASLIEEELEKLPLTKLKDIGTSWGRFASRLGGGAKKGREHRLSCFMPLGPIIEYAWPELLNEGWDGRINGIPALTLAIRSRVDSSNPVGTFKPGSKWVEKYMLMIPRSISDQEAGDLWITAFMASSTRAMNILAENDQTKGRAHAPNPLNKKWSVHFSSTDQKIKEMLSLMISNGFRLDFLLSNMTDLKNIQRIRMLMEFDSLNGEVKQTQERNKKRI